MIHFGYIEVDEGGARGCPMNEPVAEMQSGFTGIVNPTGPAVDMPEFNPSRHSWLIAKN